MMDLIKKNTKFIVGMIFVIILGIIGIAYAIKVANFNPIGLNVSTAPIDVNITYDTAANDASITSSGKMFPISDSLVTGADVTDERVIKAKFNVTGVSSNPDNTIYDVALRDISVDCDLRTEDVKWRLYKNGTLLTSGNLSPSFDVMEGNRIVLTDTQQDLTTSTDQYVFLLWISESCTGDISTCTKEQDQSKYLNKSFSASIKLELSTKSKKTLVRNTASSDSCSYSITSVPVFNSLTYNGSEQTLVNDGTGYTLINNTGTNAGEYAVTARLDNGFKWSDGTTDDKIIKGTINKKSATIIASDQSISSGDSIDSTKYIALDFLTGDSVDSVFLDTSIVNTGVGTVTPTSARIVDVSGNDVTDNYNISYVSGSLTIGCSNDSSIVVTLPSTLTYGTSETYSYTVSPTNLLVNCTSSNSSIATCSIDTTNKTITITPKGTGSVNITLNGTDPTGTNECLSTSTSAAITINCSNTATEPTVISSQDYTGSVITGISGGDNVTLGGTISATNAGTYNGTAIPSRGYCWSDSTTSTKSYSWVINKAASACTISSTPTLKYPGSITGTIGYSCTGDGSLSLTSSNTNIISVGTVGTTSTTLTAKATGSSTLTLKQAEGTNYLASSDVTESITVSASTYTLTYNNNGGSGCSSKTVTYGSTYGTMCTPTREGYVFIGWFDDTYKDAPLNYYADTYSDLYDAFGYDTVGLYNHYLQYGQSEGRRISQYISSDTYNTASDTTLYAGWVKFNYYRDAIYESSICSDGYYNTLSDAVGGTNCESVTINLLNDVTETSGYTFLYDGTIQRTDFYLNNYTLSIPFISISGGSLNIYGSGTVTYSASLKTSSYLLNVSGTGFLSLNGGTYSSYNLSGVIKVSDGATFNIDDTNSRVAIEGDQGNGVEACPYGIYSESTDEMVIRAQANGIYIYGQCYGIRHNGILRVQSTYPAGNSSGVEMTVIANLGYAIWKDSGNTQIGNNFCATYGSCTSTEISDGKYGYYGAGTEMYPYIATYSPTSNTETFSTIYEPVAIGQVWFYTGRLITTKTGLSCSVYSTTDACEWYFLTTDNTFKIASPLTSLKYSSFTSEVNSRGDNISGTRLMPYK